MKTSKLQSIQALRAYAALSVLSGHACEEWADVFSQTLHFNTRPLTFGVDVFFVISGFIMYHTSADAFGRAGASLEFIRRRLVRIIPLYWIFTTLMVVTLIFCASGVNSTTLTPWNTVASYLFWPAARETGRIAPVLSLGWTLNYEMFFYALFSLSLLLPARRGLTALLVSLAALACFGFLRPFRDPALIFWTDPIILEFAAGVLLGVAYRRFHVTSAGAAMACLALGIGSLAAQCFIDNNAHRVFLGGIPAIFLVGGALLIPSQIDAKLPRFVTLVGDSSFALYLSHRFVLRLFTLVFAALSGSAGPPALGLYWGAIIVSATIASIIVYRYVELPMLGLFKRSSNRARPALAKAAT